MNLANLANLAKVRSDFPILQRKIYDQPLIYLDSAASTLKPRVVADRLMKYYCEETANVHRGAHFLSDRGTEAYEEARAKVQRHLGASEPAEIVFTRGTTEAINLVSTSLGRGDWLKSGDEVVVSEMEHHSNIVPWQILCEERGCTLKVIPILDDGALDMDAAVSILGSARVRLVAITWCSNALGTVNPVAEIVKMAHGVGALVLIDAAQAVATQLVDVQQLGCDFLAFSGHKIFGPYGSGALYGKRSLLAKMAPYQAGGSMIDQVTFAKTTYLEPPHRFEAGTPAIADAIGLGVALDYFNSIGLEAIQAHEKTLLNYATEQIAAVPGVRIVGQAHDKVSIISFVTEKGHPADVGSILDRAGIAVRAGHHCCQPLMKRLGLTGTVRASFSIYNTLEEVDALVKSLKRLKEFF